MDSLQQSRSTPSQIGVEIYEGSIKLKHTPYTLSSNYFTLKAKVEKIEQLSESKKGTTYLAVWLTQNKYYKEEQTAHSFKVILFNQGALEADTQLEEGMWVRVSGELRGVNTTGENGTVFNRIDLRVTEVEPLGGKKDS